MNNEAFDWICSHACRFAEGACSSPTPCRLFFSKRMTHGAEDVRHLSIYQEDLTYLNHSLNYAWHSCYEDEPVSEVEQRELNDEYRVWQ